MKKILKHSLASTIIDGLIALFTLIATILSIYIYVNTRYRTETTSLESSAFLLAFVFFIYFIWFGSAAIVGIVFRTNYSKGLLKDRESFRKAAKRDAIVKMVVNITWFIITFGVSFTLEGIDLFTIVISGITVIPLVPCVKQLKEIKKLA